MPEGFGNLFANGLAELTALQLAIILAVGLASAFIRGLSGFGLALLLVPVLALTISPAEAVIIANIIGAAMGFVGIRQAAKEAEPSFKLIAILGVLLTPVGLSLVAGADPAVSRFIIAMVALLTFGIIMLPKPAKPLAGGTALTGATGVICGLLAGFAGMPGPPVVAYYLGRRVGKVQARASMFTIFLATSITACIAAFFLDLLNARILALSLVLTPVVLFGNWLGTLAFGKISDFAWRLFAGLLVGGSAVMALIRLF